MSDAYRYKGTYFPGTSTVEGSNQALINFVGNNIKHPKSTVEFGIESLVPVRYTVEDDVSCTNFKIGKSLEWSLEDAVLEMMENLANKACGKPQTYTEGLHHQPWCSPSNSNCRMTRPAKLNLEN